MTRRLEPNNTMDNDSTNNTVSLEEARKILGKTAKNMSDIQLQDEMVKIGFLVESWLDEYERSILKGKTLNEFLG